MNLTCALGIHQWGGCKCARCGKTRDDNHDWHGCQCGRCDKTRDEGHEFCDGYCVRCWHPMHEWQGCQCAPSTSLEHGWIDCKCAVCGKKNVRIDNTGSRILVRIAAALAGEIIAKTKRPGVYETDAIQFAMIPILRLPATEENIVELQVSMKRLPDGDWVVSASHDFLERLFSRTFGEGPGAMEYTCGKCGKLVFTEAPRGDVPAARLQAGAIYCNNCDEIVCMACGVQMMSAGGACPCGLCGGSARIIDEKHHPSWYPGVRPNP